MITHLRMWLAALLPLYITLIYVFPGQTTSIYRCYLLPRMTEPTSDVMVSFDEGDHRVFFQCWQWSSEKQTPPTGGIKHHIAVRH